MDSTKNSIIVHLPNWVGDAVMALPALKALQNLGMDVHAIGKPWINDLFATTGMHFYSLQPSLLKSVKQVSQIKTERVILFKNCFGSALRMYLARKKAIGYQADYRHLFLYDGLTKTPHLHEVERYWNLAQLAINTWFPNLQWPNKIPDHNSLALSDEMLARAEELLRLAQIKRPFWVLCPFAQGTGKQKESKIWPSWPALSHQLGSRQLVVCPGKNEEALCAQLTPTATVLAGLNLGEYAAVLSMAEQVISNDSGPMHVAAAVNANTFGIFGVTNPDHTSPLGGKVIGDKNNWPMLDEVMRQLQRSF